MQLGLRSATWLLLGGWLGSWALFAFVVAPTAFRVLPGENAGALVSPVLRTLHCYGVLAGAVLAGIGLARGGRGVLVALPAALGLLAGISEFGVSAAIAEVRPSNLGPASPPDAAATFDTLHRLSRSIFGIVLLGVAALVVLQARADAASPAPEGRI